jgi:hypothetical protein
MDGPITPNEGIWSMRVLATGQLHGSITRVEQTLRDRQTAENLGQAVDNGPFLANGGTPCRTIDPLLTGGGQKFDYARDLGFVGRESTLDTRVTIKDVAGREWIAAARSSWQLLPPPVPRAPVRSVVKQNDPSTGCAFDPVHGYGLLLDLVWDPPPGAIPPDIYYYVEVSDGAGRPLIVDRRGVPQIYSTKATSTRIVECDVHVDPSGEHGARFGLASGSLTSLAVSGWTVSTFDFQSCRQAGTPACQ